MSLISTTPKTDKTPPKKKNWHSYKQKNCFKKKINLNDQYTYEQISKSLIE